MSPVFQKVETKQNKKPYVTTLSFLFHNSHKCVSYGPFLPMANFFYVLEFALQRLYKILPLKIVREFWSAEVNKP